MRTSTLLVIACGIASACSSPGASGTADGEDAGSPVAEAGARDASSSDGGAGALDAADGGAADAAAEAGCTTKCPTVLAKDLPNPGALAVNGTHVYVGTADGLVGVPKNAPGPSTPTMIDVVHSRRVNRVRADDTSVYWADTTYAIEGGIFKCPSAGCAGADAQRLSASVAPAVAVVAGLEIDASRAYFTETDLASGVGRRVVSIDKATGADVVVLANAQSPAGVLTLSGATLFWWVGGANQQLAACGVSGCGGVPDVRLSLTTSLQATKTVTDGKTLYWTDASGIRTCSVSGCTSSGAFAVALHTVGIAVDATDVYWSTGVAGIGGGGAIMSCPVAGGCAAGMTKLATTKDVAVEIVTDATTIYWLEYRLNPASGYLGDIVRLAK